MPHFKLHWWMLACHSMCQDVWTHIKKVCMSQSLWKIIRQLAHPITFLVSTTVLSHNLPSLSLHYLSTQTITFTGDILLIPLVSVPSSLQHSLSHLYSFSSYIESVSEYCVAAIKPLHSPLPFLLHLCKNSLTYLHYLLQVTCSLTQLIRIILFLILLITPCPFICF